MNVEHETIDPELQQYLNDPLVNDADIDLDALNEGRFALREDTHGEDPIDAIQEQAEAEMEAAEAQSKAQQQDTSAQEEPDTTEGDATEDEPVDELIAVRQRAVQAEAMLAEIMRENTALKAGGSDQTPAAPIDAETLAALREDAPELAESIEKLIAQNRELQAQTQAREQATQQAQIEQRIAAQLSVEEAIASIPKLAHVRANDQETFSAIARIDTALGAQAVWQDRPLADRFNAALRAYEAAHGVLDQPLAQSVPSAQVATVPTAPKVTKADVDKQVAAAIAKAQDDVSHVQTLSDIHGGAPVEHGERDALLNLSETAIMERFMHMSPEQIDQELARLS